MPESRTAAGRTAQDWSDLEFHMAQIVAHPKQTTLPLLDLQSAPWVPSWR